MTVRIPVLYVTIMLQGNKSCKRIKKRELKKFEDDRMIICFSVEGPEEYMGSIKRDLHQALQSMAERGLLRYAQPNK